MLGKFLSCFMSEPIAELYPSAPFAPVGARSLLSEITIQRSRISLAEVMLEGTEYQFIISSLKMFVRKVFVLFHV